MSVTLLKQLVAESHSGWTDYAPELLLLASHSELGLRAILNKMAVLHSWPVPVLSVEQALLMSEPSVLFNQQCLTESSQQLGNEFYGGALRDLISLCWQPLPLLLQRLMMLGCLFYLQRIRVEIHKDRVRAWKDCLSDDGYRMLLKEFSLKNLDEFDAARQRHNMLGSDQLLMAAPAVSRHQLRQAGVALLHCCLNTFSAVQDTLPNELIMATQARIRLRAVLPPESDNFTERMEADKHVHKCLLEVMKIIRVWSAEEFCHV